MYLIYLLIELFIGYILGDFIMGVYHWIKDTYFSPFTPFVGKYFIWSSRLHHIRPRHVIDFTDTELFVDSATWTLAWMGPTAYLLGITPLLLSLFFTISLNDVIHKYAHMTDLERPKWATFMQQIRIFQSHSAHHLHHTHPHEINYCPVTPFVNPVTEWLDLWRRLEAIIERYTGVKPRAHELDFIEDDDYEAGIRFVPEQSGETMHA